MFYDFVGQAYFAPLGFLVIKYVCGCQMINKYLLCNMNLRTKALVKLLLKGGGLNTVSLEI